MSDRGTRDESRSYHTATRYAKTDLLAAATFLAAQRRRDGRAMNPDTRWQIVREVRAARAGLRDQASAGEGYLSGCRPSADDQLGR
jgi:hypothetical protein